VKSIWLVLIALLISGCAPTVWVKNGATQQDYNKDSYDCEKDSRQSGYFGDGLTGSINIQAFFNKCMIAHGWTQQRQPEFSNSSSRPATSTSDESEAEYYEKMAVQGDAGAQFGLGWLYAKGQGVPQNYAKAQQWWEKAAAQGNAKAQYNLGNLYVDGKGVPKNEKLGVEWIRKAAEQGDANGQDSLGEMYRDGRGVPQDNVRAYIWYNLAVARMTGDKQKSEATKRDEIAGRLTPAQIAEAQRLSQQCQAQQFKGC